MEKETLNLNEEEEEEEEDDEEKDEKEKEEKEEKNEEDDEEESEENSGEEEKEEDEDFDLGEISFVKKRKFVDENPFNLNYAEIDEKVCYVCKTNPPKYRCPGCNLRLCSLNCSKQHKIDIKCDGVKKVYTQYIPIDIFNETNLMSDYNFLEDINRNSQNAKRKMITLNPNISFSLQKLQMSAQKRGTFIKIMPRGMSKRKENSTQLDFKTNTIYWKIEFIFHCPNKTNFKIVENRINENTPIKDIIENELKDITNQMNLKPYLGESLLNLGLFLKVERTPADLLVYYPLDISKTIKENLVSKEIIEYPSFHVCLPSDKTQFPLVTQEQIPPIVNISYRKKKRFSGQRKGRQKFSPSKQQSIKKDAKEESTQQT